MAAHRAAVLLEDQFPGLSWWHDVRLAADPDVFFDHVAIGDIGAVAVHHLVFTEPMSFAVNPEYDLPCSTGDWAVSRVAWRMRAVSDLARAAGLAFGDVTSVLVVHGVALVDGWGAPTSVEAVRHHSGAVLICCTAAQLPSVLPIVARLDPQTRVLATHQLDEALIAEEVIHRPSATGPAKPRSRRGYELLLPEVHR